VTLKTSVTLEDLKALGNKFHDSQHQELFFTTYPDRGFDTWCGCGNMQWIVKPDSNNTELSCTTTLKRGSYKELVNMAHYLLFTLGQGTLKGERKGENGYAWMNMEGPVTVSLKYSDLF
jgi:hypothetical protein